MNERIRKLLNEATSGLEPDLSEQRTVTLNEMEKFAELIVKECAKVCDLYAMPDGTSETAIILAYAIRRKFGVE
jgi:hypothetical protein